MRKGTLEEGAAKTHWIKTEVTQRGYFRARDLQDIRLWPQRAAGPGWAELSPRQLRAGPEGGSYWSQTFQSSMSHVGLGSSEPGKAALPHCWHSWTAQRGRWVPAKEGRVRWTLPASCSLPSFLSTSLESLPQMQSPRVSPPLEPWPRLGTACSHRVWCRLLLIPRSCMAACECKSVKH